MNDRIDSALGYQKADIVLRNAKYVNVFTNELLDGDIAIKDGYFVGIGDYEGICEIDLKGKTVIPSFIDSHIHLESSIVSPYEFAKAVIPHGTTAVVAKKLNRQYLGYETMQEYCEMAQTRLNKVGDNND